MPLKPLFFDCCSFCDTYNRLSLFRSDVGLGFSIQLNVTQCNIPLRYCSCFLPGHLIDIVKTKGKKGFVAFMECIEFLYPELFKDLTRKDAREPFDGQYPSEQNTVYFHIIVFMFLTLRCYCRIRYHDVSTFCLSHMLFYCHSSHCCPHFIVF